MVQVRGGGGSSGSSGSTSTAPSSNQTGGSGVNGTWTPGDYTNLPSQVVPPLIANPANDPDPFGGYPPPGGQPPPPQNLNPLGGVRGGGGGGGGGGSTQFPGIDQATLDRIAATRKNYQPGQFTYDPYEWQNINTADYEGTGFYDWDQSQYDTASAGVDTAINNARTAAGSALDRSAEAYGAMGNAYAQGPSTLNQGVDPRLQASMKAFGGAGQGAAMQNQAEGNMLDAGFGSFYDLMAKGTDQYNSAMVNSVNGDRAAMEQNLGQQHAMMSLSVNMALAKAKSQYEKDKWQYGEEIARANYEKNREEAMYNNQGQNQVGMANNQGRNEAANANTMAGNEYDQGTQDIIIEMLMAGIDPNTGKQTLDFSGNPFAGIYSPTAVTQPGIGLKPGPAPAPGAAPPTRPTDPDPNRVTLGMSA